MHSTVLTAMLAFSASSVLALPSHELQARDDNYSLIYPSCMSGWADARKLKPVRPPVVTDNLGIDGGDGYYFGYQCRLHGECYSYCPKLSPAEPIGYRTIIQITKLSVSSLVPPEDGGKPLLGPRPREAIRFLRWIREKATASGRPVVLLNSCDPDVEAIREHADAVGIPCASCCLSVEREHMPDCKAWGLLTKGLADVSLVFSDDRLGAHTPLWDALVLYMSNGIATTIRPIDADLAHFAEPSKQSGVSCVSKLVRKVHESMYSDEDDEEE
ncbi:hypothetical protein BDK51DRAFT_49575 [Blyttiomyces helicus]|uniref:Uncharacterized protein n=1 Tax=Blyttiomyces helicus TaxID=388810 RepID=A0A4P9VXC9_9FUNG|nr:hypothetical protein BDK51DRAFT_49575 [Blyttiomyces helicus]|eukprot:RKO83902.1 hypothetical protein BDK51DRAFT_49575 [Blyttiomyces helicus]